MTKSEADKIAKEMLKKNSALINGEIASVNIESLINEISAALVDASKVTECADFDEWWCQQCYKETFLITNGKHEIFAKECFLAGQKSKSLKLPDKDEIHNLASNAQNNATDNTYNNAVDVIEACIDLIEKLNEGK